MPKIKLHLSIGYDTANRSDDEYVDDDEWNAMTEKEREQYLDELAQDWAYNYIEFAAWVEDE